MNLPLPGGEGGGEGIDWEFSIDMYTWLYLKWITKKDLILESVKSDAVSTESNSKDPRSRAPALVPVFATLHKTAISFYEKPELCDLQGPSPVSSLYEEGTQETVL